MRTNLDQKLADHEFHHDCDKLILGGADSCGYDALEAGALVDRALLSLLRATHALTHARIWIYRKGRQSRARCEPSRHAKLARTSALFRRSRLLELRITCYLAFDRIAHNAVRIQMGEVNMRERTMNSHDG